jgi:acetolactate synthase-1/2/3 large subunit
MPVYDELYKFKDELQHVLVRTNKGQLMLQGYARARKSRGSDSTSGPGATNSNSC